MKRILWIEILGWVGVASLLGAYVLLTFGVIDAGWMYQCMNLVGAFGLGITALHTKNYQSLVVQILWGVVGVWGLGMLIP